MDKNSKDTPSPPIDLDKFLKESELVILGNTINKAMTSSAVALATLNIFNHWVKVAPGIIKTNPGNYWLLGAIEDAVELAMITSKENISRLKWENNVHGWAALRRHRHIVSHPGQTTYQHKDVQEFYDKSQQIFDSKVIRLWGVLASITEWAQTHGLNVDVLAKPKIGLYPECKESICTMLRHSLKPGVPFPEKEVGDHAGRVFAKLAIDCQAAYLEEKRTGVMEGEKTWAQYQEKRAKEKAQRDLDAMVPDAPSDS